jgi:ornithine cyclodeaminase/alanine dehydrogenase-like protein (mu-crystallin family)
MPVVAENPNPANRARLAEQIRQSLEIEALALDDPRAVVQGSDIVAACTSSEEPVIFGEWLEPGMHVILTKAGKEMEPSGWKQVDRYVVYRSPIGIQGSSSEARWTAPPDWRFGGGTAPQDIERERKLLGDKVFNLPDLLLGRVVGRASAKEITCTSNEGTGVQFAAVALKIYQEAKAKGLGKKLPLDWFLQDVTN